MPTVLGVDASPQAAMPSTPLQAYLIRNVPRTYAVNKWFTAVLGAVVATIAGLILTALAQSLWSSALDNVLALAGANASAATQVIGGYTKGILTPDILKLFAIEHHVPLVINLSTATPGASGSVTLNLPLTGLLIVPALALTLGGYIAASSDYARQARFSAARGALIAPFYAVIVAILAMIGTNTVSGGAFDVEGSVSIGPSPLHAFLYGLLWGALFGALGGWIQYAGHNWVSLALPTLQGVQRRRLAGALAGAGAAFVSGMLIFLAVGVGYTAYLLTHTAASTPGAVAALPSNQTSGIALVFFLALSFVPMAAVWAFSFATGGALTAYASSSLGSASSTSASIGLIGAQHAPPSGVFYALLVLPAISYFIGGRIAAKVAAAQQADAFVAGALMAAPLSIMVGAAAAFTSVGVDASAAGQSGTAGVGPSVFGTFLAVLIVGAVVGGLGGMSIHGMPRIGELPRVLLLPFRPLGLAINPLLDRLTALPMGQPRSQARRWLYDGVLAALGLGIVVIVLDILAATLAPVVPFALLSGLDEWGGALLAGLPILYFTGALITAFAEGGGQVMPAAPIGLPGMPGVPMPMPMPVPIGAPLTLPSAASPYPSLPGMAPMPSSMTPIYPPPPVASPYAPPAAPPYTPPANPDLQAPSNP